MEERKLNSNFCNDCGETFYTFGKTKRRLCDSCRKKHKNAQSGEFKRVYKKHEKKTAKTSLSEYIRIVEEYNRKNGTCLTYGQYSALTNK